MKRRRGLSGIAIGAVKVAAYVLSGLCAAVGSLILTARVASGQPSLGATLPLESVAAVVLGGVSLFGGRGSVVGVAFGVLFISILSNGLNLLNVPVLHADDGHRRRADPRCLARSDLHWLAKLAKEAEHPSPLNDEKEKSNAVSRTSQDTTSQTLRY